jgi:hypothetical protein
MISLFVGLIATRCAPARHLLQQYVLKPRNIHKKPLRIAINERNAHFNKKIERAFGAATAEDQGQPGARCGPLPAACAGLASAWPPPSRASLPKWVLQTKAAVRCMLLAPLPAVTVGFVRACPARPPQRSWPRRLARAIPRPPRVHQGLVASSGHQGCTTPRADTKGAHEGCTPKGAHQGLHTKGAHEGCTPRVHTRGCMKGAHQGCTPRVHTKGALRAQMQGCTPRVHTKGAHEGCTLRGAHQMCTRVHTKGAHQGAAHQGCTPRVHTKGAHQGCTPRVHTKGAHQGATPRAAHQGCTPRVTPRVHTKGAHRARAPRVHTKGDTRAHTKGDTKGAHQGCTPRGHTEGAHQGCTRRVHHRSPAASASAVSALARGQRPEAFSALLVDAVLLAALHHLSPFIALKRPPCFRLPFWLHLQVLRCPASP